MNTIENILTCKYKDTHTIPEKYVSNRRSQKLRRNPKNPDGSADKGYKKGT